MHQHPVNAGGGGLPLRKGSAATAASSGVRPPSPSTIHRKERKRTFRRLWIARVNAATRALGLTYSRFMEGLTKAGITVNRKMLSEIAIADADGFKALVEKAKAAL